jgi:acetate CoA/acetoacetate CoA-transferase beta subunit
MGVAVDYRNVIARRAAKEIRPGMVVNLGIGIPTLVADFIPQQMNIMFHSESGVLGTGPSPLVGEEDPHLCNAGGYPVTFVPGASCFDSTIAFGMIRRGLIDITILGALEVSQNGDLANWMIPDKLVPGIGGAMDLAQKAKKVIVVMTHLDKRGASKIRKECRHPLTAKNAVDLIITEMAVIGVTPTGLVLKEVIYPFTINDAIKHTAAPLKIAEDIQLY